MFSPFTFSAVTDVVGFPLVPLFFFLRCPIHWFLVYSQDCVV